jgi:hypothetical protein
MAYPDCPLMKNSLKEVWGWLRDLSTISYGSTRSVAKKSGKETAKALGGSLASGIGGSLASGRGGLTGLLKNQIQPEVGLERTDRFIHYVQ